MCRLLWLESIRRLRFWFHCVTYKSGKFCHLVFRPGMLAYQLNNARKLLLYALGLGHDHAMCKHRITVVLHFFFSHISLFVLIYYFARNSRLLTLTLTLAILINGLFVSARSAHFHTSAHMVAWRRIVSTLKKVCLLDTCVSVSTHTKLIPKTNSGDTHIVPRWNHAAHEIRKTYYLSYVFYFWAGKFNYEMCQMN